MHAKCFTRGLSRTPPILKTPVPGARNHRFHIYNRTTQRPNFFSLGHLFGPLSRPKCEKCLPKAHQQKLSKIDTNFDASRCSNGHQNGLQQGVRESTVLCSQSFQRPLSSQSGPQWQKSIKVTKTRPTNDKNTTTRKSKHTKSYQICSYMQARLWQFLQMAWGVMAFVKNGYILKLYWP